MIGHLVNYLTVRSMMLIMIGAIACSPGISQAAGGNDQDQIILLNDSAAALEDSNPGLSKRITQFADEKEKEWEDKNANKNEAPIPVSGKNGIPSSGTDKNSKSSSFCYSTDISFNC
jgi:hypothetical protein